VVSTEISNSWSLGSDDLEDPTWGFVSCHTLFTISYKNINTKIFCAENGAGGLNGNGKVYLARLKMCNGSVHRIPIATLQMSFRFLYTIHIIFPKVMHSRNFFLNSFKIAYFPFWLPTPCLSAANLPMFKIREPSEYF